MTLNKKRPYLIIFLLCACGSAFTATSSSSHNSYLDMPVIEVLEYFGGVMAMAYSWMRQIAGIFGLVGLMWSSFKVMMSRMTVKDLWWDTLFKWTGFLLLVYLYPMITFGLADIGMEIGQKAGMGEDVIVQSLKQMRDGISDDLDAYELEKDGALEDVSETAVSDLSLTTEYQNTSTYESFMEKMRNKGITVYQFDSQYDKEQLKGKTEAHHEKSNFNALKDGKIKTVLESILEPPDLNGEKTGVDMTNTNLSLRIYLKDYQGNDTPYLSPCAMIKVSILSALFMNEKFMMTTMNVDGKYEKAWFGKKVAMTIETIVTKLPQMICLWFCNIVLIAATVFASIQYIMTVIEFTIVAGIGAIFIPLMLFDGTKDIPKKLIPVFTSFMVKFIVITICMMFVYYLILEHCVNTISDASGFTFWTIAEIFFDAILAYILTQNAPKIAQTILTGQPQLSMGEAMAAAGTAGATAAGMKHAPGAAFKAGAKVHAAGVNAKGALSKSNAASKAAKEALGENASFGKKMLAGGFARTAVAGKGLKERVAAKAEKAARTGGSGFPMFDKAMSKLGLGGDSGGSSSGGSSGGANLHGQTGTTKDGTPLSSVSNADFKSATKFDAKTGQQRNMSAKEFDQEKKTQGQQIGSSVGNWMANLGRKQDANIAGNEQKNNNLSESATNKLRAFEKL